MVVRTLAFVIVRQILALVGLGPSPTDQPKNPSDQHKAQRARYHGATLTGEHRAWSQP
jgi:hypothetical protein